MRKFLQYLKTGKSRTGVALFISIAIAILVMALQFAGAFQTPELRAYDYLLSFKNYHHLHDSPVVVIGVSRDDFDWKKEWPLTDATLAESLEKILAASPRAVGVDIFRDVSMPPGEEALRKVFAAKPPVVTVMKLPDDKSKGVAPYYMLEDTSLSAFSDIPFDPGGTVRRGLLLMDDGKQVYYSFGLVMAALYLQKEGIAPEPGWPNPQHLRLGQVTFRPLTPHFGGYVGADTAGDQFMLNFSASRIKTYSLRDLLTGRIPQEALRDKIVFLGITDETMKDFVFRTTKSWEDDRLTIAGVEIQGQVAAQLVRAALEGEEPLSSMPEYAERVWIVLWSILGGLVALRVRSLYRFTGMILAGLAVQTAAAYSTFMLGVWIPLVPSAVSWFVCAAFVAEYISHREKEERGLLMQLFSRHVSADFAKSIWEHRESFMEKGRPKSQELTATVLFTDLEGFTSVSERMGAAVLMEWLNEYIGQMAETVERCGGVINKYIGDAVMALFGVPVARTTLKAMKEDAYNAVSCGLEMGEVLGGLNKKWKAQGLPAVRMRVGIYTGNLVAGSLGSANRLEYTVIGDTVNIASRLESFDKTYSDPALEGKNCRVLIGGSTLELLDDKFLTKPVGFVKLKGKEKEIPIHLVIEKKEHVTGKDQAIET